MSEKINIDKSWNPRFSTYTCNECGSTNVESNIVDVAHGVVSVRLTCKDCGAEKTVKVPKPL